MGLQMQTIKRAIWPVRPIGWRLSAESEVERVPEVLKRDSLLPRIDCRWNQSSAMSSFSGPEVSVSERDDTFPICDVFLLPILRVESPEVLAR